MKIKIEDILSQIQIELSEKINYRRSIILDVFEGLLGHSPHWDMVRKKLLNFIGQGGLEGDIVEVLSTIKKQNNLGQKWIAHE